MGLVTGHNQLISGSARAPANMVQNEPITKTLRSVTANQGIIVTRKHLPGNLIFAEVEVESLHRLLGLTFDLLGGLLGSA